ncbi:hypothetical protein HOH87_08400 [bacterium]|jgi:membrane-anchored protein YejM (alkaline phosphatase superfamily)|nr:hypothetical protein [bacterium]
MSRGAVYAWIGLVVCLYGSGLWGAVPETNDLILSRNTIVVSVDGLSRRTLHALLKKHKLPSIAQIVSRGNVRNLTVSANVVGLGSGLDVLISAQRSPRDFVTILRQLKTPVSTGIVLSPITHHDWSKSSLLVRDQLAEVVTTASAYVARTPQEVTSELRHMITGLSSPFVLWANYTSVAEKGFVYREGGEEYSMAAQRVDRAIGRVLTHLETLGLKDQTDWVITASYVIQENNSGLEPAGRSWIVSSQLIRYSGFLRDIAPTILRFYGRSVAGIKSQFAGRPLVY